MELFVVNRYEGDDTKNDTAKPHDHLSELLKKIELRKKQKLEGLADDPETPEPQEPPKKKKKSRKSKQLSKEDTKKEITSEELKTVKNELLVEKKEDEKSSDQNEQEKTTEVSEEKEKIVAKPTTKDFMILGSNTKKKRATVKRVLPKWLAQPEIVSADLSTGPGIEEFEEKLDSRLVDKLKSNGVTKLFPVQANLISWMTKCSENRRVGWWPRDTCVSAPTGSGKTLAYVLPIVQQLKDRFIPKIRCLVVLPVQELAAQVFKVMQTYASVVDLKVCLLSGATSFEAEQSFLVKETLRNEYISRVDIVVATQGRLIDHLEKTKGFSLDYLEFLVIDEADRSTEWLKYLPKLHRSAPSLTLKNYKTSDIPPAQKLLFSATLSQDPEKLSRLGLFQPILFTSVVVSDRDEDVDLDKETGEFVGRYTSPNELTERAVECMPEYKPVALVKLITSQMAIDKTLVFTNSREAAHRLALLLRIMLENKGLAVDELSAQLRPRQREEMLGRFAQGQSQILVSSDALARGVDFPGVKLVISYDLPKYIEGYIHRSGRTGRAGSQGTAISILESKQVSAFSEMLKRAHKTVPTIEQIESLEEDAAALNYNESLARVKEMIEAAEEKQIAMRKAQKGWRNDKNKESSRLQRKRKIAKKT